MFNTRTLGVDEIKIRRGEIHWVQGFKKTVGSEMQKSRPAVVVSNNKMNEHSPTIEVVFMTSTPKENLPTHVKIDTTSSGRGEGSTVLCEEIYTISKERLQGYSYMSRVSEEDMERIDEAIMIGLGLEDYLYEEADEPAEAPTVTPQVVCEPSQELQQARMEAEFYKRQYEALLDRIMK